MRYGQSLREVNRRDWLMTMTSDERVLNGLSADSKTRFMHPIVPHAETFVHRDHQNSLLYMYFSVTL